MKRSVISIIAAALFFAVLFTLASCGAETKTSHPEDDVWEKYVKNGGYSFSASASIDRAGWTAPGSVKAERAFCDVDGDLVDELFIRLRDETGDEERALLLVFVLDGEDGTLAGEFSGTDYPIYYPSKRAFEAQSEGDERVFYRLDGAECVPALSLTERDGKYFIRENDKERELARDEYNSYFSDGEFLDWKSFYFRYQASGISYGVPEKEIEPFGEIPEEFARLVDNNVFSGAYCRGGEIVKVEEQSDSVTVAVLDKYGNATHSVVVEYAFEDKDREHYTGLYDLALSDDGGIVIAYYSSVIKQFNEISSYSSESVFDMKITLARFSADGKMIFSSDVLSGEDAMFASSGCIAAADGCYYCFVNRLIDNDSEITAVKIGADGSIIKTCDIAVNASDTVIGAKKADGEIRLTVFSVSNDGDPGEAGTAGYCYYEVVLSDGLETLSVTRLDDYSWSTYAIGTLDGETVGYDDPIFDDFDAGAPTLVVDYGDCYLIVSDYYFYGVYSSYYAMQGQAVYSAYGKDGELLWRGVAERTGLMGKG